MLRKVAEFYLWGMALSLVITLWVGSSGASYAEVFVLAMLSWPLSMLLMLAKRSVQHILAAPSRG